MTYPSMETRRKNREQEKLNAAPLTDSDRLMKAISGKVKELRVLIGDDEEFRTVYNRFFCNKPNWTFQEQYDYLCQQIEERPPLWGLCETCGLRQATYDETRGERICIMCYADEIDNRLPTMKRAEYRQDMERESEE